MKLATIAKEGLVIEFFTTKETIKELKDQQKLGKTDGKMIFHPFSDWDDFLIFSREVRKNDLLVIVSSRKGHISYQSTLEKLPYYLSKYFTDSSFIMFYPQQVEKGIKMDDNQYVDSSVAEAILNKVSSIAKMKGFWKRFSKK